MSTSASVSWLRTRTWRATFFELRPQALRAQAAPALHRLQRGQVLAPAAFLVRAAAKGLLTPRAGEILHGPSLPPLKCRRPTLPPSLYRGRSPLILVKRQGDST